MKHLILFINEYWYTEIKTEYVKFVWATLAARKFSSRLQCVPLSKLIVSWASWKRLVREEVKFKQTTYAENVITL